LKNDGKHRILILIVFIIATMGMIIPAILAIMPMPTAKINEFDLETVSIKILSKLDKFDDD